MIIMTMNLRFGLARDGENKWSNRKPLVSAILKKYPNDFLGIQEANHFQTEFLLQQLPDYQAIGWHNKSIEWWQSNLIFFHKSWHCLVEKHYFLSDTPEVNSKLTGSKWPRQCVIGLFQREEQKILVANTHFDFDPSIQEKSAGLVMDFLSEFSRGLPIIITGDFNSSPGSLAHVRFKTHDFDEVFDGISHDKRISTFHEFKGRQTGKHIDWILYQGGLVPIFRQVVKDSFSGQFPSDHYPVQAVFKWPGNSGAKGDL